MQIAVHDEGFVRLVDHMPRENLDSAIVQAARVSYAAGTKTTRSDEGLIRYLLRNWHTTPFEMVEFKFHIKMPIFVARQHLRHRTASVNEVSGRYSIVPNEFYVPHEYRTQSETNRQGSGGPLIPGSPDDMERLKGPRKICEAAFEVYDEILSMGCCRELARGHLPQTTYTEFYWKINLHNLMHYLQMRMEEHAQKEIRDYAQAIFALVVPLVPATMRAFQDFRLNSMQLSGLEISVIQGGVTEEKINNNTDMTSGERREFIDKLKTLGLINTNGV
jgi:thymidylate synthase (FAD)